MHERDGFGFEVDLVARGAEGGGAFDEVDCVVGEGAAEEEGEELLFWLLGEWEVRRDVGNVRARLCLRRR